MSDDDAFFALNDKEIRNWIAKEEGVGARCQGTVVSREEWTSDYGDGLVPVVLVAPREGDFLLRVVSYDTVLRNEFKKQDPQPGDLIDIKFTGTAEGSRGPYAAYRVLVRKVVAESTEAAAPEKTERAREIAERWAAEHPDDEEPF
jgi:hypothetical protein